jgi:hypothetical protein
MKSPISHGLTCLFFQLFFPPAHLFLIIYLYLYCKCIKVSVYSIVGHLLVSVSFALSLSLSLSLSLIFSLTFMISILLFFFLTPSPVLFLALRSSDKRRDDRLRLAHSVIIRLRTPTENCCFDGWLKLSPHKWTKSGQDHLLQERCFLSVVRSQIP